MMIIVNDNNYNNDNENNYNNDKMIMIMIIK